ncbi:MAG: glycosyltransferase [Brevinematia bacterium]
MKVVVGTDTYWPRVNGVTVSVQTLKRELEKLGHECYVFAPAYTDTREVEKNIIRVPALGVATISKEDRLTNPFAQKMVFKKLDEIKPDIIHVQTEFTMGLMIKKYALKHKIPLIITCHTFWEEYIHHYIPYFPEKLEKSLVIYLTKRFFRNARFIIVPTTRMEEKLKTYDVKAQTVVVPTGIAPEDFAGVSKEEERERSFLFEKYPIKGKKILLYVGRVGHEKNISFLLKSMQKLKEKYSNFVLIIVGDGPARAEFEKMAAELNIRENVIFTGYMDRTIIKRVYALADVFTFASKTETQGLVTVEAMICRTPVVAIGEMGTKDVMQGDNGGFMVKDDLDEFTERVYQLLTDEKLYQKKSKEAYEYAMNWTTDKQILKIVEVYNKALNL